MLQCEDPEIYHYETSLRWTSEKKGLQSSPGKPDIEIASPPEFGGHEGKWTPEDFYVASIETCIMTTFLWYVTKRNIPVVSYESKSVGILKKCDGGFGMAEVIVRPKVVLENPEDVKKLEKGFNVIHKTCLISNSIKSEVKLEPTITSR